MQKLPKSLGGFQKDGNMELEILPREALEAELQYAYYVRFAVHHRPV